MPIVGGVAAQIGSVSITGNANVGGTITAVANNVVGSPGPSVSYAWSSGVTTPSYIVQPADAGKSVSCTVTATNAEGSSSATGVVVIPVPSSAPTTGTGTTSAGIGNTDPSLTVVGTDASGDEIFGTTNSVFVDAPLDLTDIDAGGAVSSHISTTTPGWNLEQDFEWVRNAIENVFTDNAVSAELIAASDIATGGAVVVGEVAVGVTADIGAFPEVMFGLGILLGEYCIGWLLKKIANLFPNPGIFGWHPLAFIKDGMHNIGVALDKSAEDIAGTLVGFVLTPIHQILGLFQRLINVGNTAHGKSADIVNNHIPTARHDAVVTAGNYTDQQIAILTTTLNQALAKVVTDTNQAIAAQKVSISGDVGTAFQVVEQQLLARLSDDERALSGIESEVQTVLPAEIATQVQQAASTEHQALTATASNLQANIDNAASRITTLQNQIAAANTDIANAQQNIVKLETAQSVDTQAIAAEVANITAAQLDIANWTKTIDDLETQITGISTTLGNVTAAQQLNTAQLAPFEVVGAVGLATVIATLTSTVKKIQTEIDTCLVDNCDTTKPNNIQNVLKHLLGLVTAGAEIGYVADAIKNPVTFADEQAPGFEEVDQGAVSLLDSILSL
jgi:hypothetical protein